MWIGIRPDPECYFQHIFVCLFVRFACSFVRLFVRSGFLCVFVCLLWVFRPTREFFSHIETLPLPAKGFKFWPNIGTIAVEQWRFFSMPHLLRHETSVYWSSPRTRDTHISCRVFGSDVVTTCFNSLGPSQMEFEHQTFRVRGEHSNRLHHLRRRMLCHSNMFLLW